MQNTVTARPWIHRKPRAAVGAASQLTRAASRLTRRGNAAPPPEAAVILASELFDATWYAARNPGAPCDPLAAAAHYLARSADRTLDPGPDFDAAWYRSDNPDVGYGDPLLHYLRIGRRRLRATSLPP